MSRKRSKARKPQKQSEVERVPQPRSGRRTMNEVRGDDASSAKRVSARVSAVFEVAEEDILEEIELRDFA